MTNQAAPVLNKAEVSRKAIGGWLLFDWATQPVFTLVTTFVFGPFFASAVAATPAEGQALWGYAAAAAGLAIALLAPVLGAVADRMGARKPWIAAFSLPLVAGCTMVWWTVPGTPLAVPIALAGFIIATLGVEFATVFNNAMMADLVPRHRLGRLSGSGWALGYIGGLVSLIVVLGFMAANPDTGKTLVGLRPIFGLDPATHAGDRASGPFSAIWYMIFVLPLFLFTPDAPKRARLRGSVKAGLADLRATLAKARSNRAMLLYLVANMTYKDGLAALFAFGGIYAAGVLGWGSIEIGVFGILAAASGVFGSFLGGRCDDRFGPKMVIAGSLLVLILCGIGIVSVDRDTVFFVFEVSSERTGGLFSTVPEVVFLVLGAFIGAAAGPLQAASRTLLVHLAPEGELTQYFGLFALSGKVTSFLAPLSVGLVTSATGNQAAGVSVILVFLTLGLTLLSQVEDRRG